MLETIIRLDFLILQGMQKFADPLLDSLMQGITFVGNPLFWIFFAALVYWHGKENESFYIMNLVLFSAAVAGTLKIFVGRMRPSGEMFRVIGADYFSNFSFPSGHAVQIAAAFAYMWRFVRRNTAIIFGILVLAVVFSRIYLGVHYFTDVLAGMIIGFGIGEVNYYFRKKLKHSKFRLTKVEDELLFFAVIGIAFVAILFFRTATFLGVLIGFYAGFFLLKEMGLGAGKQSVRETFRKTILGIAGMGAMAGVLYGFPSVFENSILEFALFTLAGFWISFLCPFLYQKFLKKSVR